MTVDRVPLSARPAGIRAEDRRRVDAVRDAAAGASSLGELLEVTLAALEEHLGYATSALMLALAEPPFSGRRAYAGVTHGAPPYVLEEYFERWADCDPLGSEAAQASFVGTGRAALAEIYPALDPASRRFVDEFLPRTFGQAELSHRLPVGGTDAYVTLLGREDFGERDERRLRALAPALTEVLRTYLPRGLDAKLSLRESQTAELVALGFSNRQIAGVVHVEEDTVKKHVSSALAKLGLHSRTALAVTWATGRRMDLSGARP